MEIRSIRAIARIAVTVIWTALILAVLAGSIEDSPLRYSSSEKLNLIAILPEGWSFFTRNPREATDHVYHRQEAGWVSLGRTNSHVANLFGARRTARIHGIELSALLQQVAVGKWHRAVVRLEDLKAIESIPVMKVTNPALRPTLCGQLLVQRREPVPWAWSSRRDAIEMPADIVRLRSSCRREDGE